MAKLVSRLVANEEIAGSSPAARTIAIYMHMIITLGALRRLILSEAPLAAIEEPGVDADHNDPAKSKKKREVQRFFKSKKFADDAIRLYRNLAVPIYLIPLWSSQNTAFTNANRTHDVTTKELIAGGVSPERAQEIEREVSKGACALVVAASVLLKGGLPTPWMIVHAIIDNINDSGDHMSFAGTPLDASRREIQRALWKLDGSKSPDGFQPFYPDDPESYPQFRAFLGALSMRSARTLQINSVTDAVAEILTQALITRQGFSYRETGIPAVDEALRRCQVAVEGAKTAFEELISGRMIRISVFLRG